MASAALAADPMLRRRADLCPLWQGATGATDCPPGGALIASPDLPARAQIMAALATADAEIAAAPGRAHALLAGAFPELAAGPGASAYAGITATLLVMPADAAPLSAFYGEIFALAPQALGGALPGPGFYAAGTGP
jgi:NitT/TauT family transport system substrate-binding protein